MHPKSKINIILLSFLLLYFTAITLSPIQDKPINFNNNNDFSNLNNKEKIEMAYSDLVTLEEALTLCHEETGWYVSLENLDDTLNPLAGFDYINYGGGTAVIDDNTGMFDPALFDFTNPSHPWLGPYVIYQPSRIAGSDSDYDEGSPLDPWDKEYLFYSPLGLIEPKSRSISLRYGGNMFDRYAVLSRGPDMVISADDLVITFGIPPESLVISFLNPNFGYPGDEIEIWGYNFGDEQSTSKVLFKSSI